MNAKSLHPTINNHLRRKWAHTAHHPFARQESTVMNFEREYDKMLFLYV